MLVIHVNYFKDFCFLVLPNLRRVYMLGEVSFFMRRSQITNYSTPGYVCDGTVKIELVPAARIWVRAQIVNAGTNSLSIVS
jgi:hypothetical protein